MLRAAIGLGVGDITYTDAYTVGANACQDALDHLGGGPADLFIVFSTVKYDQRKMLEGVCSVAGNALVVGSSTAGEITTDGPVKKNSVAVMAVISDTIKFYGGVGENIKNSPKEAGRMAA